MMSDEETRIFEKAKSALIKLGSYSEDKDDRDETKINDRSLEYSLNYALERMHSAFKEIKSNSIQDAGMRRLYQKNILGRRYWNFDDIDEIREVLSQLLPVLQENGLIDRNELALKMMESIYNERKEEIILQWEIDNSKGIKRIKPMSAKEWPFLNGVWRQHSSEYIIAKSVLDGYGIDVKEDDVKKLWEERNYELFKRNNTDSISTLDI